MTNHFKIKISFCFINFYLLQKQCFHVGLCALHFATSFAYIYWSYLSQDIRRFECLNFLFIPDLNDLCNYYNLGKKATKIFLTKANLIRALMYLLMFGFEFFFILFLCRCLSLAYFELDFNHFLFFSIPLAICSYFSYHCLTFAILTMYTCLFVTQEFLKLRATSISQKLLQFTGKQFYRPDFKHFRLRKSEYDSFEIMRTINSMGNYCINEFQKD